MPTDSPYRIVFVCSGNICRSPIAEAVIRSTARDQGLGDVITVESSGTGEWHVGQPADERAVAALATRGYDGSAHRARQFQRGDFHEADLVVALDRGHERALRTLAATDADREKVRLLRSFDPGADSPDVADPYYEEDEAFTEVLEQVEAAAPGLLEHARRELRR